MTLASIAMHGCRTPYGTSPNPDLTPYTRPWESQESRAAGSPLATRASVTRPVALTFEPAIEGVTYAWVPRGVTDHGKFGYLRFEADTRLPSQSHFGDLHFLVLEGALSFEITGAETLRVEQDDCITIPSRTQHALHADSSKGALCYVECNSGLAYFVNELKAPPTPGKR